MEKLNLACPVNPHTEVGDVNFETNAVDKCESTPVFFP
jgi:hypothetical protein